MSGAFDPESLLRHLSRRKVDYVLIGAFAAALHGSPLPTMDLDVCPARNDDNIARLADLLLVDVRALWETTGAPFPGTTDEACERLSAGSLFSFDTVNGRLDVVFEPAGTTGYHELARRAVRRQVGGIDVDIAALEDIIRSKQAAGREADLRALPVLRKLLEHQPPNT
jgi:hypothetical protein